MTRVTAADAEFAGWLDQLAAEAVAGRDYLMADYLFGASDWHSPPSEATVTARIILLSAAAEAGTGRAR